MDLKCGRCPMLYQNVEKMTAPRLRERGPCPACKFGILTEVVGVKAQGQMEEDEALLLIADAQENMINNWLQGKELTKTKVGMILDSTAIAMGVRLPAKMAGKGFAKFASVAKDHLPNLPSSSSSSGHFGSVRSGVSSVAGSAKGGVQHAAGFAASHLRSVGTQVRGAAVFGGGQARDVGSHLVQGTPLVNQISQSEILEHATKLARALIAEIAKNVHDMEFASSIMAELPGLVHEVAANVVPFISPAMDMGKTVLGLGHLGTAIYRKIIVQPDEVERALSKDAVVALDALNKLLDRQILKHGYATAKSAISAGTKTTLTLLDGGAISHGVVGAAAALGDLVMVLTWIITEAYEAHKANKILKSGEYIDATIFAKCPLVACYILTCCDTSNIIDWMAVGFGSENWTTEVGRIAKAIQPVLTNASLRIDDARWEIAAPNEEGFTKVHRGNVIRATARDGDLFARLGRLKQYVASRGKAKVLHANRSAKEDVTRRKIAAKVAAQAQPWDIATRGPNA